MVRRTSTEISREIGAIIDEALIGTETTVTRYGRAIAVVTRDMPENPDHTLSVSDFVATTGHWLEVVENGQTVILTRRDRPVVGVIPFEPELGGYTPEGGDTE